MLQKFLFCHLYANIVSFAILRSPAFQGLSIQFAVVALACSYCQLTVGSRPAADSSSIS